MRKFLLKAVFLLLSSQCVAQDHHIIFSGGLIYQKRLTGDFTVMYGDFDRGILAGVGLGSEFVFMPESKPVIAPKMTAQFTLLFVTLKASEINYLHGGSVDIRVLPEVGVSAFGLANLSYGYNIHLFGNKFTNISSHRVALTFCLPVPIKNSISEKLRLPSLL